jgi:hypothetical protein
MTYIPSSVANEAALNNIDLTILYNTTSDVSISSGSVVQWGSEYQLEGSVSYSVSSGVITLASGYYYLLKTALACYGPTVTGDTMSYQLYDTGSSAYIGRRGHLCWQESTFLTGGDEYAIALIDASSSAQTIDCRVLATSSAGFVLDPTASTTIQHTYGGRSRLEIFRWT